MILEEIFQCNSLGWTRPCGVRSSGENDGVRNYLIFRDAGSQLAQAAARIFYRMYFWLSAAAIQG